MSKFFHLCFYSFLLLSLSACSNPLQMWKAFQKKAENIFSLDQRYHVLQSNYEKLEKKHVDLEGKYVALLAEVESKKNGESNLKLTGSKIGRTLASIEYKVPQDLDHSARIELAYQHMKEQRFAYAGITFDSVLWEPEGAALQTGKNFYEAGVAWFQVKNYKKSKDYFAAASAHAEGEEKKEIQRRVDLWMRVLEKNKG